MNGYRRVLIKLSGEALAGTLQRGFDHLIITDVVKQLKILVENKVEVSVVIGGGNFWRGRTSGSMDRTKADQIGMLATVMNAIYVADVCRAEGIPSVVQTPFQIGSMTELFSKDAALAHMQAGKIVFFAGGTGHPFFSTDTGAALRGCEIEADALLFAKNIDGVYDSDPKQNPEAKKYTQISCQELLRQNLKAIDAAAATLCIEQKLPIVVFDLGATDGIVRVAKGEHIGTTISIEE
ncbi:UMP kinase [Sporanaerobium hydrogeniformans]|uniref:UMP kinase n=1 Tax=Sporanaerobium hydrogeniformans TaxID=3072179 RepID=A0AC61DFZ0_9FIRM|nr:UMP kinase [Sporanaerobium hydrogeniformans]PHV71773.1 UMP kinase [Sporanaerobium hydrogeniformans]